MNEGNTFRGSGLFLAVLGLLLVGLCLYIFFNIRVDSYSESIKSNRVISHAIIVHSQGKPLVTELLFIHPDTHRAALYYVPENTGTILESVDRMDRIDQLFDPEDPWPYVKKIDKILGTSTQYYLSIELENFSDMIDWMGGLEVFVSHSVWQPEVDPPHLLPSGTLFLEGGKIDTFLQYRLPDDLDGDIINRKLTLVQSFLTALAEHKDKLNNSEYYDYFRGLCKTNLDDQSYLSFLGELQQVPLQRIITQRVMGRIRVVDGQELLFPLYDEQLLKEMISQIVENLANVDGGERDSLVISVEIQNGTSINGLASRTAQLYKSYGFRIASVKNADRQNYENTIVLDKRDNPTAAQRVANIIHCDRVFQSTQETTDNTVDIIIILGKDFDGRYIKD
ncbi:MAG: LCP family protein [Spirochaetaceae bacterium]|jgi:anionic cell wall polymer biosynthesis LytR-Cps2A-Psr (LCP) family protein|nr:LCP family protein [Spirochaetaceae bacterium]